jgi:glyoxylase-like metal-dependent hydrolase (beta-lactamase superfamily II)
MQVNILEAGACYHPEIVAMSRGKFSPRRFPALVVHIHNSRLGDVLFDTGYTSNFLAATECFPYRFYRWITPVELGTSAKDQLLALGIKPGDIRLIILSHLHADHIAGVRDFPNAELLIHRDAFKQVEEKSGLAALRQGFLPALLPEDFRQRAKVLAENDFTYISGLPAPVEQAYDLAADGRLLIVPLPGHSPGQLGLLINESTKRTFFVADACWLTENLTSPPHPIVKIVTCDYDKYLVTLDRIRDMAAQVPGLVIIPSHCSQAINRLKGGGRLV